MKVSLKIIANLTTGIYAKPDIYADTFYLQGNHFSEYGYFDTSVNTKPQLQFTNKIEKHLLQNDDVLFTAKGFNNFAVVYNKSIGQAVASSSFIVIRIKSEFKSKILSTFLAWYLSNSRQVEIFHNAKSASTIPSISIKQLAELEITIPSIEIQSLVVKYQQLKEREKAIAKKLIVLKDQFTQEILLKAIKN